jgi:SSS family solute:Na+ symporter
MNLPWNNNFLPITALMFAIWIPNLYYWGLNQYIMQRTLGSQSLSQGQKGIIFAAFLKLLIPFIVIFPGIMAFNLYNDAMKTPVIDNVRWQELTDEYTKSNTLFTFDKGFVKQQPEVAAQMVEFNATQMGSVVQFSDPMEVLETQRQNTGGRSFGSTFTDYDYDSAFSLLARRLIPEGGLRGFMMAAVLGMIVSTLAAMYNAASTIFTIDIYKEYLHRKASEKALVMAGRTSVLVIMLIGCMVAPVLADPRFGGLFWFIQEFQGFISPGVLAAFLFGFLVRKAPRMCGVVALLLNPIIYGALMVFVSDMSFLNRMGITFISIIAVMSLMTAWKPLKEPFKLETATTIDLRWSKSAMLLGTIVFVLTIALYVHFWDFSTPMFENFSFVDFLLGR